MFTMIVKKILKSLLPKEMAHIIYCIRNKTLRDYLRHEVTAYFIIFQMERDLEPNRSIEDMVHYIKNYKRTIHSRNVAKFLLKILNYSLDKSRQIVIYERNDKPLYVLHVCAWGADYTNKMLNFLIPSLLSHGNIPSIAHEYNVQLYVHCDQTTMDKLKKSTVIHALCKYAVIKYEVVPQAIFSSMNKAQANLLARILSKITYVRPNWKYHMLGCMQNLAMLYAQKNKAFISFLMPDLLFSDQAISKLFVEIKGGQKAAVATAFRTLDTKVQESLKLYYQNDTTLNVPSNDLSNVAVNCMHTAAQNRIASKDNPYFHLTAQLIFHYSHEIVIRAFHYHPILVNFNSIRKLVKFDYNPIDANFLCNIVDYDEELNKQIWVNDTPSEIGMMEISRVDIEPKGLVNRNMNIAESVRGFANSPHWTDLNRYLASKRCIYRYDGHVNYFMSSDSDSSIFQWG